MQKEKSSGVVYKKKKTKAKCLFVLCVALFLACGLVHVRSSDVAAEKQRDYLMNLQ